ncbi:MAG: papain-like cysteine protease family protein [Oceanospirillaceae bacterium]
MALINGQFKHDSSFEKAALNAVNITFSLPIFSYTEDKGDIERTQESKTLSFNQMFSAETYSILLPGEYIVGDNANTYYAWLINILETEQNDSKLLEIDIPYQITGHNEVLITASKITAIASFEDFGAKDISSMITIRDGASPEFKPGFAQLLASKVFFMNASAYSALKSEIASITEIEDESRISILVRLIAEFSDNDIVLLDPKNKALQKSIEALKWPSKLARFDLVLAAIRQRFADLIDFTIDIGATTPVSIAGSITIETDNTPVINADLAFYHLTIETQFKRVGSRNPHESWKINLQDIDSSKAVPQPLPFTLDSEYSLIAETITGKVIVRMDGYEGKNLWTKSYDAFDKELADINISILQHLPGGVESTDNQTPVNAVAKLRGKVVASDYNRPVHGLTVVIQARVAAQDLWKTVAAGETGKTGDFSVIYPQGVFVEAQALLSLAPDSAVDLKITPLSAQPAIEPEPVGMHNSIANEFIYLLVTGSELPDMEDCSCTSESSRLPDHTDLVGSKEYSQDLGPGCINVNTPNRSLREYTYNGIVRMTDPKIAKYTLEKVAVYGSKTNRKNYRLSAGDSDTVRDKVDLSNPIQWQDVPGTEDELSFYQPVTVATGHILTYKMTMKADGYSLGDCVFSLPLAPGQKKQIVSYNMSNVLEAQESQVIGQSESLSASLLSDRNITNQLSGQLNENLNGQSFAKTGGVSAGLGLAGLGAIAGVLGVSGGFANSSSSASQSGNRVIAQNFGETLRQNLMQNVESYRELNASVVTTVKENQQYSVTTEAVANHNHCHSLTMLYFEVLRHYAVYQSLVDVKECVFVPFLLTEFTQENSSKWKDILSANLRPIPSNTHLPAGAGKAHPLLPAFDANERMKTNYTRVDFPAGPHANETMRSIDGEIKLRVNLPRPRTSYDRILSIPIVVESRKESSFDVIGAVKGAIVGALAGPVGAIVGGFLGGSSSKEVDVLVKKNIFDAFMTLDGNYASVPPAQAIRIVKISQSLTYEIDGSPVTMNFFPNEEDKEQWQAYFNIINPRIGDKYTDVYDLLDSLFSGRLISEWDDIFYKDIAPYVVSELVNSIEVADAPFTLDLTQMNKYTRGDQILRLRASGSAVDQASTRSRFTHLKLVSTNANVNALNFATAIVGRIRLSYTTDYFSGPIINLYKGDDLFDGVDINAPLTSRDKRNPRKEDQYLAAELFEHLNSNLEYYNRILLINLDAQRRHMLLDGFHIETYDKAGQSIGFRSIASVVKNELITITGNSLVFPVAEGFKVNQHPSTRANAGAQVIQESSLLDHYRPAIEPEPYRLSVPTRGVYMEAVMGQCDACEPVKKETSQDWDKFRTEEPTAIGPVATPTPVRTDWKTAWAQFAAPQAVLQSAPSSPAAGAGLAGLSSALTESESFRDVTGLAANQANVIKTYESNQESARAFAEMAKEMAIQEHNTENADKISKKIDEVADEAKREELKEKHVGKMIDGGASEADSSQSEPGGKNSLVGAAAKAIEDGRAVEGVRTDPDGTVEKVKIDGATAQADAPTPMEAIYYNVPLIAQPNKTACWAASMAMLESYRLSEAQQSSVIYSANQLADDYGYSLEQSYGWDRLGDVKEGLGLETIEISGNVHPSPEQWREMLIEYGPLYVTIEGIPSHAIVVNGISGDATLSGTNIDFLNPTNTTIDFDNHDTIFTPANNGLKATLSVEELNQAFNGGELSKLKFYENWRILYHPDLAKQAPDTPDTTGQASRCENLPSLIELRTQAIAVASAEALHWTVNNLKENSSAALARLQDFHLAAVDRTSRDIRRSNTRARTIANTRGNNAAGNHQKRPAKEFPWSAVFISWCYVKAYSNLNPGVVGWSLRDYAKCLRENNLFNADRGHFRYVQSALAFRTDGQGVYVKENHRTAAVEVGDWIYTSRSGGTHVDIVLAIFSTQDSNDALIQWALAAGGNITNTAGFRVYSLDTSGLLASKHRPIDRPDDISLNSQTGLNLAQINSWAGVTNLIRGLIRLV